MIQAKCIQKFRDKNGKIYEYRLIDINGQTKDVKPENLKQAIKGKQIHVVNLTLTSDNRLVDSSEKQLQSKKLGESQSNVEEYMHRLQTLLEKYFGTVDCVDPCEKVGETVDFTMPDDAKIECYINNKRAKFILWENDYESFIVECEDITENAIKKAKECIFNYISGNNDII